MGCAKLVIADNGPRADEAFDTTYEPDRVLQDGESVEGDGWSLRAVATPGHPAHGKPVEKPQQLVRSMIGHRRQRERQILRTLEQGPLSLPEFIPVMYKGLDPRLEKAAQMSVHAHLIDLERRNMVNRSDERWAAL